MTRQPLLSARQWQDLIAYKNWEVAKELTLPVPWLVLFLWSIQHDFYLLSFFASAYFFLTCVRISHNSFHYSLGLTRNYTHWVMLMLSVVMLTSMHAAQFNHMQHHKHCLTKDDLEGRISHDGFFKVLLLGFLFTFKLHKSALQKSSKKQQTWIRAELALNAILLVIIWFFLESDVLKIHTALMIVFHAISPVFTVWSVHHGCQYDEFNSRTSRNSVLNFLVYNMFYHLEHHLYPAIPTCHWPELSNRLDRAGLVNYKVVL